MKLADFLLASHLNIFLYFRVSFGNTALGLRMTEVIFRVFVFAKSESCIDKIFLKIDTFVNIEKSGQNDIHDNFVKCF